MSESEGLGDFFRTVAVKAAKELVDKQEAYVLSVFHSLQIPMEKFVKYYVIEYYPLTSATMLNGTDWQRHSIYHMEQVMRVRHKTIEELAIEP